MDYQDLKTDVRTLLQELDLGTTDLEMRIDEGGEADDRQTLVMAEVREMLLVVSRTHNEALEWLAATEGQPDAAVDARVETSLTIPVERRRDSRRWFAYSAAWVVPVVVVFAGVFVSGDAFKPAPAPPPPMTETDLAGWLVRVPGGTTDLGTSPEDRETVVTTAKVNENNKKRIQQELASRQRVKSFYMGRTEVTVGQWKRFVDATEYLTWAERNRGMGRVDGHWVHKIGFSWDQLGDVLAADVLPVVNVTRADAQAFCQWLSDQTGDLYRLPTEAEWEHAARAGTTTRWHSGDDLVTATRQSWNARTSGQVPHPVGQMTANPWGLLDMSGSVWEWTTGTWPGKDGWVVMRGGSFRSDPWLSRSASRAGVGEFFVGAATGFRVVREINPAKKVARR